MRYLSYNFLKQKQSLPLEQKEIMSLKRIKEFNTKINNKSYIAFSGGKDSTVLLHLIRRIYPSTPAVYCNTGLEYPETTEFVKTFNNVQIVYPQKNYITVIKEYGYPIISKETSKNISRYRNTKLNTQKEYRLYGTKNGLPVLTKNGKKSIVGVIPKKWRYLVDAPFLISDKCCDILKKNPLKKYEKESGNKPFIGTMASDSNQRTLSYLRTGCNSFAVKKEKSSPLSFWNRKDIDDYIKKYNLPVNPVYALGEIHTGCIYCCFGCHLESHPNRFERMKQHHPKLYDYCMNQLGLRDVLNYIGVYGKNESD
jgi:3'-phosphoadenosine 5'-phosphosulfate sulfotransferase (PAPS reductase)/FAD synthetase